jgi:hypothetical protein
MTENGSTNDDDMVYLDAPRVDRDRDGVASLRDTDSEQGDESEVDDSFILDETAARELNIDFVGDQRDEPRLD